MGGMGGMGGMGLEELLNQVSLDLIGGKGNPCDGVIVVGILRLYPAKSQWTPKEIGIFDGKIEELRFFFNDKTIWFSPIGQAVQKMIYSWWVLRIYGELSMVNFRRVWHRWIKAVSLGLRTSSANWERLSLNQPVWRGSLWRKTLLSSAMHSDFFFWGLNDCRFFTSRTQWYLYPWSWAVPSSPSKTKEEQPKEAGWPRTMNEAYYWRTHQNGNRVWDLV